jgi:hypothetical protein
MAPHILQATIPLANHSDHHISISFVAAHGSHTSSFFVLSWIHIYSLIQEQVVLA